MGWGERSCLRPCRCPEQCSFETCNVDCTEYVWDGKTQPDSSHFVRKESLSPGVKTGKIVLNLKHERKRRRKS